MATEWVVDNSGEGMWMRKTSNGRYIGNTFDLNATENIPNVKLRHDDIVLCSYAKTGTHWLWENLRILVNGKIQYDKVEKDSSMMEYFQNIDDVSSPRVLNNHAYFDDQPKDLIQGKTKVVLLYRNPKDVAYSLYHHHVHLPSYEYKGVFGNFQKRFVQGKVLNSSYFDYLKSWENGLKNHPDIPYLLVRYEDLHENPIAERRRLANFIGRDYNDHFLQEVTKATSIDTMRRLKSGETKKLKGTNGVSFVYRKGKVGDWKEHFTFSESEWFDGVIEREVGDSTLFHFRYTLDESPVKPTLTDLCTS